MFALFVCVWLCSLFQGGHVAAQELCSALPREIGNVQIRTSTKGKRRAMVKNVAHQSALQAYIDMENDMCLGPCIQKAPGKIGKADKHCSDAPGKDMYEYARLVKADIAKDKSCVWSSMFGKKHVGYRVQCKRLDLDLQEVPGTQCPDYGSMYMGSHELDKGICWTKCAKDGAIACDDPKNQITQPVGSMTRTGTVFNQPSGSDTIFGCRVGSTNGFRRMCAFKQQIDISGFAPDKGKHVKVQFTQNLIAPKSEKGKKTQQSALKVPKYTKHAMQDINRRYAQDPNGEQERVFGKQVRDIRYRHGPNAVANKQMVDFYEQDYDALEEEEEDSDYAMVEDELDDLLQEMFMAGYNHGLEHAQRQGKQHRYLH